MKRHLILWAAALAGAALMNAACSEVQETQHYSLFFDHIRDMAAQEGISLKEAATKVRELGYEGTDINVAISPEDLAILDELGFQYPCVICNIDFSDGEFPDKVQQALHEYEPSVITRYILDVCAAFNRFYHDNPILNCEDSAVRLWRVRLTAAARYVLGNAFELICLKKNEKI